MLQQDSSSPSLNNEPLLLETSNNHPNKYSVAVYSAASENLPDEYKQVSEQVGQLLAQHSLSLRYGAGNTGLMYRVAKGCMDKGGYVTGILPQFMVDRNWHINKSFISELIITETMHERKQLMIQNVCACIALPGGVGTLEELLEAITWRQIGLYDGEIIVLNTLNYYEHLIKLLGRAECDGFVGKGDSGKLFKVAQSPEEVIDFVKQEIERRESNLTGNNEEGKLKKELI